MNSDFSKSWNRSIQPRKQRKYIYNAPLNVKTKLLSTNLSKELRKKYNTRNITVRKGDKVKVLRGSFKGKEGTVEEVDRQNTKLYITKVETTKKDGSKVKVPVNPSNVQITELNLDDKMRKAKLEGKKKQEASKNG